MTKALVVDDNKNDRMLLFKMLTSNGFDVVQARNGVEAIKQVGKEKPDIIVSDIMMPKMDGFTLLRALKENRKTKSIPLVFYTATYVSDEDKELGLSLGASRFLIKPEEPEELLGEIRAVLNEFEAGKIKPEEPAITEEEYLKKYSERIFLKLESKIKDMEEEIEKRKEVEKAIRTSEEKLHAASLYNRSLIEVSLDPLVTLSFEGKITDVNKAVELVTGVSREQLIGSDFSDYVMEPEKAKERYQQVLEKGFVKDYPLAIRHVSGSITDVLYNASVYMDAAGNIAGVFAAGRDVTERKRAEETLQKGEKSLREAQRLAHIGSWQWTVATDTVKWSEELYHINGLDPNSPAPSYAEM